ncbi:hypothetical protein DFH08DRAFT_819390 [Mycena albidolilacea]|uniref:Uncharacterized protein n=1 Tax=Mycena albidolilacea TaxID=1033008 RepID=A0AAD7EG96_9AGAR|nr:hypothetical protein DFH08DRAFT_819390 [Mycena albidolilacea]
MALAVTDGTLAASRGPTPTSVIGVWVDTLDPGPHHHDLRPTRYASLSNKSERAAIQPALAAADLRYTRASASELEDVKITRGDIRPPCFGLSFRLYPWTSFISDFERTDGLHTGPPSSALIGRPRPLKARGRFASWIIRIQATGSPDPTHLRHPKTIEEYDGRLWTKVPLTRVTTRGNALGTFPRIEVTLRKPAITLHAWPRWQPTHLDFFSSNIPIWGFVYWSQFIPYRVYGGARAANPYLSSFALVLETQGGLESQLMGQLRVKPGIEEIEKAYPHGDLYQEGLGIFDREFAQKPNCLMSHHLGGLDALVKDLYVGPIVPEDSRARNVRELE